MKKLTNRDLAEIKNLAQRAYIDDRVPRDLMGDNVVCLSYVKAVQTYLIAEGFLDGVQMGFLDANVINEPLDD